LLTASFGTGAKHPGAIAICRGVPTWYKGLRYIELAPTKVMLQKENLVNFDQTYARILADLNPQKVYDELCKLAGKAEPVLLCWEAFGLRCHRRWVAEFFEAAIPGLQIPEIGHARADSIRYVDMPRKGTAAAKRIMDASKKAGKSKSATLW